jgi:metal transporter CNNM
MVLVTWIGILLCISQSAMLSGLNLACFTISKLELKMEVGKNNRLARRVLSLREDANFLLVTILWGNVAVNVLLALLSGSVLTGVLAFLFSTVIITIFGEIVPQAYFSRHALRIGSLLSPVLRFYQVLLFPVAKPTALVLDRCLGPEAIPYFKEKDIRELIRLHMESAQTEIEKVEGQGALNFLALDDVPLAEEGEPIDPKSIVSLSFQDDRPVFPKIKGSVKDDFLRQIHVSGKKWIVLVDEKNEPRLVIDSDEFIRDALFNSDSFNPYRHLHRPIIEKKGQTMIGDILSLLKVKPRHSEDDVVDYDVILLWDAEKRVITGADVLGRLLRGIVRNPAKVAA